MTFNISKLGLVRKNQLITANIYIYIYNLKKYRSLYFASWHFVSLRSVVFSGWTPRFEGRKTSVSNLLLFQWASKPTLNAVTSSCFAAALDSTTLRQRECKKKNTTTNNNNNNKTEKNTFNKQNNNFARASHIFCTFHGRFARRDYVVETPNFAFWASLDNQRRNFFFQTWIWYLGIQLLTTSWVHLHFTK